MGRLWEMLDLLRAPFLARSPENGGGCFVGKGLLGVVGYVRKFF